MTVLTYKIRATSNITVFEVAWYGPTPALCGRLLVKGMAYETLCKELERLGYQLVI